MPRLIGHVPVEQQQPKQQQQHVFSENRTTTGTALSRECTPTYLAFRLRAETTDGTRLSYQGCVFHRVIKDFAVIGGDIAVSHAVQVCFVLRTQFATRICATIHAVVAAMGDGSNRGPCDVPSEPFQTAISSECWRSKIVCLLPCFVFLSPTTACYLEQVYARA